MNESALVIILRRLQSVSGPVFLCCIRSFPVLERLALKPNSRWSDFNILVSVTNICIRRPNTPGGACLHGTSLDVLPTPFPVLVVKTCSSRREDVTAVLCHVAYSLIEQTVGGLVT
jgi:hypothetical protein